MKVTINWHGEIRVYYTAADNEQLALRNSVARLAKDVGRSFLSVWEYVTDPNKRRWEVQK